MLVGNTLGLELKKFEDGWYYNLHWIRKCLESLGLELGFRGPANIGIGIGIGKEVIYTKYLGLDLGFVVFLPIIQRLALSLVR